MRTTCSKCGSIYELTYVNIIMRDSDSIDCKICGEKLYSWSEAKSWNATLIVQQENHKQKKIDNEASE